MNECSTGPVTQKGGAVWAPPAPFVVDGATTGCVGTFSGYDVDPAPGVTITWDYPAGWATNNIFPNNNGGFFNRGESGYVVFTKTNVCFAQSDSIYVDVTTSTPAHAVLAEGSLALCQGIQEFLSFNLDPTTTYSSLYLTAGGSGWQLVTDTDTSMFLTPSYNPGPFNLAVTSNNACGATVTNFSLNSIQTIYPSDAASWETLPNGLSIDYYAPTIYSYQWLLEGQPIQGATQQLYVPTVTGNYALEVSVVENGCPLPAPYISQSQYVEVAITVGVNEAATSNMSIYPNPFNTEFVIETTELTSISVMNAMGEVVLSRTINGRTSIDATTLAAGIYFVREETSGVVMKLVKN